MAVSRRGSVCTTKHLDLADLQYACWHFSNNGLTVRNKRICYGYVYGRASLQQTAAYTRAFQSILSLLHDVPTDSNVPLFPYNALHNEKC